MAKTILSGHSFITRAIGIHAADLVCRLHFEDLAGEEDMPGWLV